MNLNNNTCTMNQRNKISMREFSRLRTALIVGITPCITAISWGQTNNPPAPSTTETVPAQAADLAEVVVTAETMSDGIVQGPFLPDVVGTSIYAGKKTSVIDFDAMPQIQNDNYRQAFSKTPGLLTSEVSNSSLLSLSYRGIGDPHESQNLMVLKNGIPFVLDPLGYSTVYFAPPFESVDRLEFVSGGAALLYGSQPSGALNYITHVPDRSTPFKATTQHIIGSNDLYSTFSTLEGGNDKSGYLLNLDHRSGDSFRRRNSDFELNGAELSLFYDIDDRQKLTATIECYDADHGEPGGRSVANYASDRIGNLLNHDRVRLDRLFGSIGYEVGDESAKWITKAWASDVVRYSKRQTGQGFGTVTGNQLDINQHTYYTLGLDSRALIDYQLGENKSTFTAGVTAMNINAPIFLERTAAGDLTSDRGATIRNKSERDSVYAALFAENLFRFGRFTVTPAVRLEYNKQSIDEQVNVNRPANLFDDVRSEVVPLGGIGATFDSGNDTEIYANVSSSYKPPTYADAFPLGGADTFSENLDAGRLVNSEIGFRGRPTSWSMFDASLFHISYDNRFGRVGSNFQNVGESVNQGFSFTSEIDFYDMIHGESELSVIWYSAYQYLDAEFTDGPVKGNTPQYAPEHMLRTGLIVQRDGKWKIAAMLTHLSQHWADDANTMNATANWSIPSYTVLDITAEAQLWSGQFAGVHSTLWALCGINNALDEEYTSRIRANGIDPASDRNYYIGIRAEF
ncbi:MAG: TonB-dependent receptor [Verrucomicrobia bacterium]|nr:MAG: TonB-dependent receptor [Verrucomicrobiota bacterium]